MDATKAYILSENESHGIALANVVNAAGNTAIMEEHESESYTDLIDDAVESLGNDYDLTILVTRKPFEASIAANKTNKLRAVVCRTQADASKARQARANIVIMDDGEFTKTSASGIMRGWIGSAPDSSEEEEEPEKGISITEMGQSAISALNSKIGMIKKPSRQKARAKSESKDEDDDDIQKPKGGGLIKNIKYMFGIE